MQASKTQIFGYLWHLLLFSNAFFNTQKCQKAEEYICPQVGLSSTAQVIVTLSGKIRRVLHVRFDAFDWPEQTLKSYIIDLKARVAVYVPIKDDPTD